MTRIGIAICGLPQLADDIVSLLTLQVESLEVVARLGPCRDLEADAARSGAEILICSMPEAEMAALWDAVVRRRPSLTVLNLVDDYSRGRLYSLRATEQPMDEVSEITLLEALTQQPRSERLDG